MLSRDAIISQVKTNETVRKHKTPPDFIRTSLGLIFFLVFFAFGMNGSFGQKLKVVLGQNRIGSNEIFTITLTAQDQAIEDYSNFPSIPGFNKAGTSSSSSMRSVNGQVTNESSIIQNYMPEKEGTFTLKPFTIKVNGQSLKSPGATIVVGPPVDNRSADPFGSNPFAYDPFEDFFKKGGKELGDVKADAFFSIQTDKKEIWAGEGLNVTISFFVSDENQAELTFHDIGTQLAAIVRKIKPENCWEENFGIEEITPRKVTLGKKGYTEYRIYQATIYPLVAKSFTIPSLKLDMIKYKTGQASFFGAPGKEEIKPFFSKPVSITVKPLPNHPMKGNVSVGRFSLEEKLSRRWVSINEGLGYEMTIKGEGNISYIPEPQIRKNDMVDIYPPNTQMNIQRAAGRVTGQKTFSYLLVPKEQGQIQIAGSLFWIFFDPVQGRYDTLLPGSVFQVMKGKSTSAGKTAKSEDSFYGWIDKADSSEISLVPKTNDWLFWINLGLGTIGGVTLFLSFLRRR